MTRPADPPTFDRPEEARAHALTVALAERGLFTWNEWTDALSGAIAEAPDAPYYDRWMTTLDRLVTRRA